jgi:hypothetical protein
MVNLDVDDALRQQNPFIENSARSELPHHEMGQSSSM